ncbi:MAG: hypothetical protein N0C88_01300 [Candidatus Thiodiazotropha lotti]|uniref:Uncharacterized protein n=1 Tax=Candidatus Thiodiazotropha lotti TaxID=2792787 RepID=A0A9E4K0Q0_9GAMM|nr:hypothetical protein [Candidatus Thiodiazotropha lotti]MCW4201948.1 hypothetical protein [Candidatus Thiodiazotropha lotti]
MNWSWIVQYQLDSSESRSHHNLLTNRGYSPRLYIRSQSIFIPPAHAEPSSAWVISHRAFYSFKEIPMVTIKGRMAVNFVVLYEALDQYDAGN